MIQLLRNRSFALLWSSGLISQMGDWALGVALPIYVFRLTGSSLATSGAFAAELIPALALGSVAGVFVDRWNRRYTVIGANVLQAIGLLPLIAVHSAGLVWIVYLVGALQSILSLFLIPASNALLPAVVAEEDLVAANSLTSVRSSAARLVGPALGGAFATLGGLPAVTFIDAGSFVIAGLMTVFVFGVGQVSRVGAVRTVGSAWRAVARELLDGLALVRRDSVLTVLVIAMLIMGVGEGVFGVMFVIWVRLLLHGGALQLGWFMSAQAVGGLLGGIVVAHYAKGRAPLSLLGASSILFALIDMSLFSYPILNASVVPGLILIAVVGIPGAAFMACWNTLMQTRVADEFRGRVFGFIGTAAGLGQLGGTIVAGTLGGIAGPVLLLNLFQGGAYLITGAVVLVLLRQGSWIRRAPVSPAIAGDKA